MFSVRNKNNTFTQCDWLMHRIKEYHLFCTVCNKCVPSVCCQTLHRTAVCWGGRGSWYRWDTPPWISLVSSQSPPCQTHTHTSQRCNSNQQPAQYNNAQVTVSPASSDTLLYFRFSNNMCVCVYERPMQSWKEAARAEEDWAHREHGASLVDPVEVASGHVSHADSSSWTVQELVAISDEHGERRRSIFNWHFLVSNICK